MCLSLRHQCIKLKSNVNVSEEDPDEEEVLGEEGDRL